MDESGHIMEGSRVRVTGQSVSGDQEADDSAAHLGREYDVCYFVPAGAKGNDDPNGRAYYLIDEDGSYGGSHWAYPEHLQVLMTPAQMAARTVPTVDAVRKGVAGALMSMYDPIEVDEADYGSGSDAIVIAGSTSDGLRVQFRVRIDVVEEVDW